MRLILVMVMVATAISTSGCASRRAKSGDANVAKVAPPAGAIVNTYAVSTPPANSKNTNAALLPEHIEKVPFQVSTSSVTVERLAQAAGCTGGKGAGLVTEKGPVEVYRMQCDNGKVFLAKCELRQCAPLRW